MCRLGANGLDLLGDSGVADGAEVDFLRAGHTAAVVPARNKRAVHLADKAYLAKDNAAGQQS